MTRLPSSDSGLAIDLKAVDVYEFADGKIVLVTLGYSDSGATLKAVGPAG